MWVNTDQSLSFRRRCAIATITESMIINVGSPRGEARLVIQLFTKTQGFDENFVRRVLREGYGDVSKWQLHVVVYNVERNGLDVVVSSPDFDEVDEGVCLPFLKPTADA
jgi:hypothetical protein